MNRRKRKQKSSPVKFAEDAARFLWPEFACNHGCVFLARYSDANPPPIGDTATNWESFVNHTHVLDEFPNEVGRIDEVSDEVIYDELHPDFISACELGTTAARLWALKLSLDFPEDRFRVYYTQYDNPIVRFHKVREEEPCWLSDEDLSLSTDSSFREALVYDTRRAAAPIRARSTKVQ